MIRKISFKEACARFVNRYTMEHVPPFARSINVCNGKFYAPQFASDEEWYENTRFYGEEGHVGSRAYCTTSNQSWPLGQWLQEPYKKA